MAEAVATVGLVAAIIQISKFAKDVILRYKELHSATKTLPEIYRSIGFDLPVVLVAVDRIKDHASVSFLSEYEEAVITALLEACCANVKNLNDILAKVLPSSSANKWDKAALAMQSLRYESDVRKTMACLDSHVQKLMFYQMSSSLVFALPSHDSRGSSPLARSSARSGLLDQTSDEMKDTGLSSNSFEQSQIASPAEAQSAKQPTPTMELISDHTCPVGNRSLAPTPTRKPCLCRRSSSQRTIWSTRMTYKPNDAHQKGCPYHRQKDNGQKRLIKVSYASRALGLAIDLALSVQSGSGGFIISPTLALRGARQEDSPLFALLWDLPFSNDSSDLSDRMYKVDLLLDKMRYMIDNGEASPYDLDEQGLNVFGVSVFRHLFVMMIGS